MFSQEASGKVTIIVKACITPDMVDQDDKSKKPLQAQEQAHEQPRQQQQEQQQQQQANQQQGEQRAGEEQQQQQQHQQEQPQQPQENAAAPRRRHEPPPLSDIQQWRSGRLRAQQEAELEREQAREEREWQEERRLREQERQQLQLQLQSMQPDLLDEEVPALEAVSPLRTLNSDSEDLAAASAGPNSMSMGTQTDLVDIREDEEEGEKSATFSSAAAVAAAPTPADDAPKEEEGTSSSPPAAAKSPEPVLCYELPSPKYYANSDKSEGIVEIDREKLVSEFFEAKLTRWQDDHDQPQIVLKIPVGCDAELGAKLMKDRLENTQAYWGTIGWFRRANGEMAAFAAAVHIFHMTLLHQHAKEVLNALRRYRIPVSKALVAIALELEIEVVPTKMVMSPIFPQVATFRKILKATVDDQRDSLMAMANRAIAGWKKHRLPDLINILVETYFHHFTWDAENLRLEGGVQPWGLARNRGSKSSKWLLQHFFELTLMEPKVSEMTYRHFSEQIRQRSIRSPNRVYGNTTVKIEPATVNLLMGSCLNALFVQCAVHPEKWAEIAPAFRLFIKLVEVNKFVTFDGVTIELKCVAQMDPSLLAIAGLEAQTALLKQLPLTSYAQFKDKVGTFQPGARHFFLENLAVLSDRDLEYLLKDDFPGIVEAEPELAEAPTRLNVRLKTSTSTD